MAIREQSRVLSDALAAAELAAAEQKAAEQRARVEQKAAERRALVDCLRRSTGPQGTLGKPVFS